MRRLASAAERLTLAAQNVSPTVRLVGGAGLELLLGHRHSDDLDLFGTVREDIDPIVRAVEAEAERLELKASRVRTGPGFVRLEVPQGEGTLRVDVAADASPRLVTEDTLVGPVRVESLRDQRANKIVALLGRSELRDLVDLYFIEEAGLAVIDGLADALVKDGGMDPAWFAWAVEQIPVRSLRGLLVPLELDRLTEFRARLIRDLLDRAGAAR
jgi:hypothetical protein